LSRHIINSLGGKIWFESVVNEGSTFFFTIPIAYQPEDIPEQAVEHKINYNWKDKVILIVEDDEINAQFLEAVLDQTQVQTLYANNGLQAIELCNTINKIDLVLMDIKMPEMSGYEACKKIKSFRPTLPMIAQTAFAESVDRRKCMAAGFDEYISKPIDIELLFGKIFSFFNH
jgi:CheY-like chemotaxis protein